MERKLKNDEDQATTTTKTKQEGEPSDCSQIDNIIGSYGKYQFLIFLFKILIGATSALNNLGVTFYAPTGFIGYWCADTPATALEILANQSYSVGYESLTPAGYHHHQPSPSYGAPRLEHNEVQLHRTEEDLVRRLNMSEVVSAAGGHYSQRLELPSGQDHADIGYRSVGQLFSDFLHNDERNRRRAASDFNSDTPQELRKECSRRIQPRGASSISGGSGLKSQAAKCTAFEYDTGIWMSTIIDEWDLVCEKSWLISLTQSLYMSGFIVSYLLFGYLSDRFGRWRTLLLGACIEIISGFGCAFSTSVVQFMMFRFLLGLGNAGRSSSSYLIMIEWTGQSWRMPISTLGSLGWIAGYCTMPWLSLYFLHFRHMQIFVCLYELALVVWLLQLPESPRWLLTHRRFDEARKVLLRAARFNGLILKPDNTGTSSDSSSASSSNDSLAFTKSASLLRPAGVALRKLDLSNNPILAPADGSFARKRLNSISAAASQLASVATLANLRHDQQQQQQQQQQHPQQQQQPPHESIILAPNHEVAAHVEVPNGGAPIPSPLDVTSSELRPYTMAEFERKFTLLAQTISQKEFTKNEDRLSFIDLFRWRNLRKYTFVLAIAWCCNSFIYYGIALRVGDFGGKNLFVSFSLAGVTEFPSMLFTILFMKFLPRKTTNSLMFSIIFLLCALQAPLKYLQLGWLQQTTMILAKLFNSCSFICILYQTMELFPTSIRQTAYSSCSLAGRVGSILAPFIKELAQLTNPLVPSVMFSVLSLMEIPLIRQLPETKGSDLPDTLLEAEKFEGTDAAGCKGRGCGFRLGGGAKKQALTINGGNSKPSADCCSNGGGSKAKLPPV